MRRDGRAVEGARLERVYRLIAYRGFESHSLRQAIFSFGCIASSKSHSTRMEQGDEGQAAAPEMTKASERRPLILLVAGEGFEPSTFGL
jgi:hypothetical protein